MIQLQAAGVTDVGLRRQANEDSILLRDDVSLWAVADGMGGHQGGQWASEQVRAALERLVLTEDFDDNFRKIGQTVHAANAAIDAAGQKAGAVMGTTVAILHSLGSRFAIFWAGDSRVYLHRQGQLCRMTTDHTQVQELIDSGLLTPQEAQVHPSRHILSRAVGAAPVLTLDAIVDELEVHDRFLLCSDGLTGVVSESEISEHMQKVPPNEAAEALLKLTLARGAPDNVTIVVVASQSP
jgi:serine/threonine-protein phosphatase Stp1